MTAESCPHCFAPARANGRPGCACAARAAASAATAGETDDQIRPRPYVTLSEESTGGPDPRDLRLFEEPGSPGSPGSPETGDAEETRVIDRVGGRPGGEQTDGDADENAPGATRHRKSRRKAVIAVLAGAATVAVAGSLAIGTGLVGGETKDDGGGGASERTLADTSTSTSAPADAETPAEEAGASGAPAPSAPPHPSASGAARPSASASGAAPAATARPSASVSVTRSAAQPEPTTSSDPRDPTSAPPEPPEPTGPPVLREGDSGPEVVELQKRLGQLLLYIGVSDGKYDDGVRNAVSNYQSQHDVTDDPDGVYGENTRRDLESRTDEP
ncbi:peptidoglycan-binding domain-containing protein [Streptomyces hygroscopicus]|uniref:peptidoglycan-binding domain-containing protein n=1 Tax=Streptomyces hygroscopicus TaxID=1912 RepID=UPI00068B6E18|nr:peptidoglycan-binding domain-containing protein [Streptomyces hygroscopicus]